MLTTDTSATSAPRLLSGGIDQILGEFLCVLWVIWAFRANELAPVLTPQVSLGLSFVGCIAIVLTRPRGSASSLRVSIAALLFIGVWIMSALWSWNFWVWFAEARVAIALIVTGMLIGSVLELERIRRGLLTGIYLAMMVTIALSLSGKVDPGGAWLGAFAHKNLMGGFFAVGILVVMLLERNLAVKLGASVGCLALVFLSQSATALLMVGAAMATIVVMRRVAVLPPREAAAYFFSISTTVVFVLGFFAFQSASVVAGLGRDGSLSGRTELWPAVWEKIQERPLIGWGPGLWIQQNADPARFIGARTGFNVGHSHNTFLEVLLLWGVVGLVMYFGLIIAVVRSAWRLVRVESTIATLSLGFVAVLIVQSISEPALGGWVAMLAMLHVLDQRLYDQRPRRPVSSAIDDLDLERLVR